MSSNDFRCVHQHENVMLTPLLYAIGHEYKHLFPILLNGFVQVGAEYLVREVKVFYKSSFSDVEQSTVYVGNTQCGQIHQNLPINQAEKSVVVSCNNGNGYLGSVVWIKSDRLFLAVLIPDCVVNNSFVTAVTALLLW